MPCDSSVVGGANVVVKSEGFYLELKTYDLEFVAFRASKERA